MFIHLTFSRHSEKYFPLIVLEPPMIYFMVYGLLLGKLHLEFLLCVHYRIRFTDVPISLLFAVGVSVCQKRLETKLIINSFYPDETSIP